MKVLYDPIYSTQPHKCSSSVKFKKITEDLLAARDDVFIYWPIPDWADEAARAWLPQSDRIRYIPHDVSKDRVREYQCYYRDLEDKVAFFGSCWDYDVLVTMRTAQVANMRVNMNSPRMKKMAWLKKVVLLEEMAILDFRRTVPVSSVEAQDPLTILGYLTADVAYITAKHVREGIIKTAKGLFAPSMVNRLRDRLKLVNPAILDDFGTKTDAAMFHRGQEPFCLGFVGRMSNSMTRLPEIYDVMDKNWIMKGDKGFKVLISTVSTGVKLPPPDFAIFENNTRERFWERVKEDMHLVISMSVDAEFSLSLIEPVIFGTPLVIAREDWTEGLLGPEYPFFVKGKVQAYGMVRAFHDDYAENYARFLEWRETHFLPRFQEGGVYAVNLYKDLHAQIVAHDREVDQRFREGDPNKEDNKIARMVMEEVGDAEEFNFFDALWAIHEAGKLRNLGDKLDPARNANRHLTFMTPWHELKVILRAFYGVTDGGIEPGHMRKVMP